MNVRHFQIVVGVLLLAFALVAGTNSLTSVSGGKVLTSHVNQFFQAFSQDLVPRNSSGVATDLGGTMGESALRWKQAYIASGDWQAGDVKLHHTYNGLVSCGEGWMLADGRQVTQSAYDTEHGSGHWATYVGSSILVNKYLPNMTSLYPIGIANTTQDGSVPIVSTGNGSSQINIAHTHTIVGHAHTVGTGEGSYWYTMSGNNGEGTTDALGTAQLFDTNKQTASSHTGIIAGDCGAAHSASTLLGCIQERNWYDVLNGSTDAGGTSPTGSALSATQDIRPESIQLQYCMRVVN